MEDTKTSGSTTAPAGYHRRDSEDVHYFGAKEVIEEELHYSRQRPRGPDGDKDMNDLCGLALSRGASGRRVLRWGSCRPWPTCFAMSRIATAPYQDQRSGHALK